MAVNLLLPAYRKYNQPTPEIGEVYRTIDLAFSTNTIFFNYIVNGTITFGV